MNGIIGTLALADQVQLEIAPKVVRDEGLDWKTPLVDLLSVTRFAQLTGETETRLGYTPPSFLELMARLYSERLRSAIQRDGPIQLLTRAERTQPILRGKLQVTSWVRRAVTHPHQLPCSFDELSVDNDFTAGLAVASQLLGNVSADPFTKANLSIARRALRPGLPAHVVVPPEVEHRTLPEQFAAYRPAWAIASAILAQRQLTPTVRQLQGFGLTMAGSSLLEDLLTNSLRHAGRLARNAGKVWDHRPQSPNSLMHPILGPGIQGHNVIPDDVVFMDGQPLAILDAKYKLWDPSQTKPPREDLYQVITSAAVVRAPAAVLVYPEELPTRAWRVTTGHDEPRLLVAVGIDMLGFRARTGFKSRGERFWNLLRAIGDLSAPVGTMAV